MAGEGWWMGFESIDQSSRSSEVERNPKMSILFISWRGVADGVQVIDQTVHSSEVECNPKMSILFFWLERGGGWGLSPSTSPANHQKLNESKNEHFILLAGEGWQMGFESLTRLSIHQKLNIIQKMSILFFWLERGGGWGSSPSTSPADHQKLNVIQKQAFYVFGWRGVADGV